MNCSHKSSDKISSADELEPGLGECSDSEHFTPEKSATKIKIRNK